MRIQRALLLCLAGVPFAAACQLEVEGSTGGAKSPHAATSAPAAASASTPPPAATPGSAPAPASAAPSATTTAGKAVPFHLGGGGAASTTAADAGASSAACLDQGVATVVADCTIVKAPIPTCPGFSATQQKCSAFKANFDAKVASAAVACLASSTSAQACDATRPLACAKAALAQACPDPNVGQLCQIAATACKATVADCTSSLSGLNSQGQQAIAQCVALGCTAGLSGCLDALK